MKTETTYTPINCSFYDVLEHYATLKSLVQVVYLDNSFEKTIEKAIITDLRGNSKTGEIMYLQTVDNSYDIRMDYIVSINGTKFDQYSVSCSI
ncbi:hypothetical protein [Crocinitomix catalasitica]|uniref:hypothetical protein n=1 Tax=Crocinitomix catalasitica TaxID=184607 RepID=UPI00056B83B6|nr:hypothetical protein [Crocinitomix catalasitica]